jgi:hypothetical protein
MVAVAQSPFTHVSDSEPEPDDELEEAEFERDRGMVLRAGNVQVAHSAALFEDLVFTHPTHQLPYNKQNTTQPAKGSLRTGTAVGE